MLTVEMTILGLTPILASGLGYARQFQLTPQREVVESESWILSTPFLCNPARPVGESSYSWNSAHAGRKTQSLRTRAAYGGGQAGLERTLGRESRELRR